MTIDPRALRDAFGCFMTGVTVVTTIDADGKPFLCQGRDDSGPCADVARWREDTDLLAHDIFAGNGHAIARMTGADLAAIRRAGLRLGVSTHDDQELTRALAVEPEVMATVQQTLDGFASSRGEATIIRFDHVSSRKAGQRRFVDLHMHMPASWSLGRAAAVRTSVEQALMSAVPGLRASIQLLPTNVEAHFDDPKDLV